MTKNNRIVPSLALAELFSGLYNLVPPSEEESSCSNTQMDKVFGEQLKFHVIDENLERFSKLTFTIGNVYQHPNGSLKAVIFEIVDESNPFLFYSLKICEDDFSILKNSQGLLVDFLSFPKQTIQLLEKCMVEENEQNPRFSLIMTKDVSMAQVDIVELNGFRRLVHLSLKFVPPTEQKLRSELANAIKALKDKNANLVNMLEESSSLSEKRIQDLEKRLSEKALECERLRIEKEEKLTSLSDRALMELEREKEKASEMETRIKEQYTTKFEELRNEYERNLDRMETRFNEVEGENKVLQDQSQRFELSLRDAQAQLKASNEECKILNSELMVAKQKVVRMNSELKSQEKSNQLMSNKISILEKDLRDKDMLIMKLQGQLGSAHETNRKFAEEMDKLESTVLRREEAITNVTEDLVKANQIIAKLHADNKSAATKLQARSELILQQEKVVENRESEIKSLKEEMKKYIEERIRIEDEMKRHKEDFEDANEKLQDQEKTLKTNETVISWLNQQIVDLQKQLGTAQGLTSRQVAATLSNIGKQPHLGQLRATRCESNKSKDDSGSTHRGSESPIDPIYFEPSPQRCSDTEKESAANRDSGTKNAHSRQHVSGSTRRPFLKSSSLPSKDKKEQKQASAYFPR